MFIYYYIYILFICIIKHIIYIFNHLLKINKTKYLEYFEIIKKKAVADQHTKSFEEMVKGLLLLKNEELEKEKYENLLKEFNDSTVGHNIRNCFFQLGLGMFCDVVILFYLNYCKVNQTSIKNDMPQLFETNSSKFLYSSSSFIPLLTFKVKIFTN
jgi:hypothetical protein